LRIRAGNGGDVDEAAAPELAHLAAEGLRAKEIAGEIDRDGRIPFSERQRVQCAGAQDGGGVDEDTAGAERFFDRFRCRGDARCI
jgi:hypothetical protein